jgi:GNAT superfamily N-acetyltransferase
MLHCAFSRLDEMGIACSCATQTTEVTRRRAASGDCFVAVSGERIVGTITLNAPEASSDSRHYRDAGVASVRQLGVDPRVQGKGVGTALLRLGERWASRRGYARLALDTPEAAGHLIGYYCRQGFCLIDRQQFSSRPYRSVVFAKPLRRRPAFPSSHFRRPYSSGRQRAFAATQIRHGHIRLPTGSVRTLPCHQSWLPRMPVKQYSQRC